MSSKQAALDLAPAVIATPTAIRQQTAGKIHLCFARFHRAASQDRLVDQPNVERRREAAMVWPIRHHRNGLPLDRPQTGNRDRRSPHAIDRTARADAGRSTLWPQTHHAPRCAVNKSKRGLEPLLIPRSR